MARELEVGMPHSKEASFCHVALQMDWGPVSMARDDNSGQGEFKRERVFLQIPTAEEGKTRTEGQGWWEVFLCLEKGRAILP